MARSLVSSLAVLGPFAALSLSAAGCCFGGTASPELTDPAATATAEPAAAQPATAQHGSCDVIASVSTCTDWSGDAFVLGEDFVRGLCTGTYNSNGDCPAGDRIGSCSDGLGTVRRYYGSGALPYTVESARQDCAVIPGWTFTEG
ncbi:MAG: hypothetical protein ACK6CU_23105 [Deltaproteobacteria bacterium]|jgi:hypothetical protein